MFPGIGALNLFQMAMAVLIAASGFISFLLFIVRIRRRDLALLYFGLGAGMYGLRLFLQAGGRGGGRADLIITAIIPIPLVLLMVELAAPEWKTAVWWIVAVDAVGGAVDIIRRAFHVKPDISWLVINVVVLASMPLYVAMAFLPRRPRSRDLNVLRAGLLVFLAFVIYSNLFWLGILPGSGYLEFIGFMALLGSLGYVALARTQRNEERLFALHKELEIARDLQGRLLPQSDSAVAGLAVASRYVPATAVAGDFYDFLVNDGGLGVLIADVSGHGIPAALSASMVKLAVRAQMDRAADPAEVLHGMNSILCGNLQGQFVSAGYLFLDPDGGRLAYSGAGHPPLLVWRSRQQRVESMEENGLLLGLFPGSAYTTKTAPLAAGDRCLLYTDGLLEAPGPSGEEFGAERLKGFLAAHASLAPQRFCDALVEDLVQWCGKTQQLPDDVTIVAIDLS